MDISKLNKRQIKALYAKFQQTEEYKKVNGAEKSINLSMNGIMFFLFDHWLSKQPNNGQHI